MKKLLIAVLCLNGLFASAQLSLRKLDGTIINNGDVFDYHVLSNPDDLENPNNYLGLKIFNTGTATMHVKAEVVSMVNSTGDNLQLCIGDVCLSQITVGSSYPSNATTIAPGGENSDFDHLLNGNGGIDTSMPVLYTIRVYQLNGNVEVGNSVTFTYRYSALLTTTSFNTLTAAGIQVKSNIVHNQLEVRAENNATVALFDMTGKRVQSQKLIAGENTIDTSNLNAGVYIANFKNDLGQSASSKIIKK